MGWVRHDAARPDTTCAAPGCLDSRADTRAIVAVESHFGGRKTGRTPRQRGPVLGRAAHIHSRAVRPERTHRPMADGVASTGVATHHETITGGRMVTRELAEWVAHLQPSDVPDAVLDEAGRAPADFLGETPFVGAPCRGSVERQRSAPKTAGLAEATIIAARGAHARAAASRSPTARWRSASSTHADWAALPFAAARPPRPSIDRARSLRLAPTEVMWRPTPPRAARASRSRSTFQLCTARSRLPRVPAQGLDPEQTNRHWACGKFTAAPRPPQEAMWRALPANGGMAAEGGTARLACTGSRSATD